MVVSSSAADDILSADDPPPPDDILPFLVGPRFLVRLVGGAAFVVDVVDVDATSGFFDVAIDELLLFSRGARKANQNLFWRTR